MSCLNITVDDNNPTISNNLGIDGGSITFGAWVKVSTQPGTSRVIAELASAGTDVTYIFRYESTPRLTMLRDRNGIATDQINYNVSLTTDQWYHLAASYDGTNHRIFLDGDQVLIGSGGSGNGNDGVSSAFSAGSDEAGSPWNGQIAHVFVYNSALSAADIKRIMLSRPPANDPNLRLYWPLNEGAGTTVNDYSMQRSFNGTITTATWSALHPPVTYK